MFYTISGLTSRRCAPKSLILKTEILFYFILFLEILLGPCVLLDSLNVSPVTRFEFLLGPCVLLDSLNVSPVTRVEILLGPCVLLDSLNVSPVTRVEFLLGPCILLALVLNHEFSVMEILWTFSIYLESGNICFFYITSVLNIEA